MPEESQHNIARRPITHLPARCFKAVSTRRQPQILEIKFQPFWTLDLIILVVFTGLFIWSLFASFDDAARILFSLIAVLMLVILLAKPAICCAINCETQSIEVTRRFILPFLKITRRYSFADIAAIHIMHSIVRTNYQIVIKNGYQVLLLTQGGEIIRLSDDWLSSSAARSAANRINEHMELNLPVRWLNY